MKHVKVHAESAWGIENLYRQCLAVGMKNARVCVEAIEGEVDEHRIALLQALPGVYRVEVLDSSGDAGTP